MMLFLLCEKNPGVENLKNVLERRKSMDLLCGIAIGLIIASIFIWNPWMETGTLRIDRSDPEKDVYRLELNDLDRLCNKKYIRIKIDHNADLSQK